MEVCDVCLDEPSVARIDAPDTIKSRATQDADSDLERVELPWKKLRSAEWGTTRGAPAGRRRLGAQGSDPPQDTELLGRLDEVLKGSWMMGAKSLRSLVGCESRSRHAARCSWKMRGEP